MQRAAIILFFVTAFSASATEPLKVIDMKGQATDSQVSSETMEITPEQRELLMRNIANLKANREKQQKALDELMRQND